MIEQDPAPEAGSSVVLADDSMKTVVGFIFVFWEEFLI